MSVIESFDRVRRANPQGRALTVGTTNGAIRKWRDVSYAELDDQAERVAQTLRAMDLCEGDAVALCTGAVDLCAAAILGVLKAAMVVVPVDPRWPEKFRRFVLGESASRVVLTTSGVPLPVMPAPPERIDLDRLFAGETQVPTGTPRPAPGQSTACIVYSSGYGLAVDIGRVSARARALRERLALGADDRVLTLATPGQGSFVCDVLLPLSVGARLVVPPSDDDGAFGAAHESLIDQSVTCLLGTPDQLRQLTASNAANANTTAPALRVVLCRSALLSVETASTLSRRFGSTLLYAYSPPEVFADVAFHECGSGEHGQWVPAGKDMTVQAVVMDQHLNPSALSGSVFVHADGVRALDGQRAAQAVNSGTGATLVRTGEQARWGADGALGFLGSDGVGFWNDGMRFELNAIKGALLEHPSVAECHLAVKTAATGDELIAFVVGAGAVHGARLSEHLSQHLPSNAVPAQFVAVDRLPLTADGVVDHRALCRLAVPDAALAARWEARIKQRPGVDAAKGVIGPRATPTKAIHYADLFPESPRRRANTATADGPQTADVDKGAPAAFSDGGALRLPPDAPGTLTEGLLRVARIHPDKGVLYVQTRGEEDLQTYSQLLEDARRILAGLHDHGLGAKDRVLLHFEALRDHVSTFWACLLGGIVPVTVALPPTHAEKNGVLNKLWNAWRLLDSPTILCNASLSGPLSGVPALYAEDQATRDAFRTLAVERLRQTDAVGAIHESRPEDVAFCQLSSGSTGVPKCVQITHRGVVHHIHGAQRFNAYGADDVSLNWLPLDHVVPILTSHLKDTYLGTRQIMVSTSIVLAEPLHWLDLMQRHRVSHSWAPNFGYKLINDALTKAPGRSWDLSSVRMLMAAVSKSLCPWWKRFCATWPPSAWPNMSSSPPTAWRRFAPRSPI